jgi:DNA topoisomerase-1
VGRFGPYIKYGAKYASMKVDDPYTVTLERALELIRLKQEADANRIIADFKDDGIQVLNGRYGPYITDGKKNAKVPKDRAPPSLTLEECKKLLEEAPERGARFGRRKAAAKSAPAQPAASAESSAAPVPRRKRAAGNGAAKAHATTPPRPPAARAPAARTAARTAASRAAVAPARSRAPSLKTKSPAKRARVK